jgi:hypothetical protein
VSFQAYLDNIKAKTGKTPQDFKALAEKKGLLKPGVKAGEIVAWLKEDFGLGHGHAMAIVNTLKSATQPKLSPEEKVSKHFSGNKAIWRKTYDELLATISQFGPDIKVSPTNSYLSILRKDKKFAIVQVTSDRMNIGIKRKGIPSKGRFEEAGAWNNMVTHRVRIHDPKQIDAEVISWLQLAYEKALR